MHGWVVAILGMALDAAPPFDDEWSASLGSATIAIREKMNHRRSQELCSSGEDADRVRKSASGTAKYTLHQRCMAHALGFGAGCSS